MESREELQKQLDEATAKYNTLISNGLVYKARTSRRLIAHLERRLGLR